jgi:hypothetical protein
MEQFTYDELCTLLYVLVVHMNKNISNEELCDIKNLSDKIILLKTKL